MQTTATIDYFDIMGMAKKSYAKLLAPLCKEFDLTRNELDVLLFLHNNPQFDRAADIVSRRGIAKSHVSLSVTNLEGRGHLLRRFDENDRRTAHLELTESGRAIAQEAREVQTRFFSELYREINPEEFALWGRITKKVCENIRNLDKTLTFER